MFFVEWDFDALFVAQRRYKTRQVMFVLDSDHPLSQSQPCMRRSTTHQQNESRLRLYHPTSAPFNIYLAFEGVSCHFATFLTLSVAISLQIVWLSEDSSTIKKCCPENKGPSSNKRVSSITFVISYLRCLCCVHVSLFDGGALDSQVTDSQYVRDITAGEGMYTGHALPMRD